MKITRRDFLRIAGRAGAALPFVAGMPACAPVFTAGDRETGLSFGCVAGDVTADEAIIWLRGESEGKVSVLYGKEPTLSRFIASDPVELAEDCDHTGHLRLQRLEPGTAYYYRAAIVGKKPGPIGRFVTAPAGNDLAPVKFCFSGDSRQSYRPFAIMDAIRATKPDFFIHLGDTIYADIGGRASRLPQFWAKYRANRADGASRRLFADTSVYVTWDDHEVANDYEGFHPLAAIGRKAFFDYWPVRRDLQEADRLYRSFRWGGTLELFLLDVRQYRDRAHETMLGKIQKEWLFDSLASSAALFKCIATAVPLYGGGRDRWDGYPLEREEILRRISQKKIEGVLFISADLHYAAVRRMPGQPGLKNIVAGPIGAPMNVIATGFSRSFEFFSNTTFNYGMITIDPRSSRPQLVVEIRDEDNNILYKTKTNVD